MGQAVLQGLAKHLVKEAHISEKDALKALEAANKEGRGFADQVVSSHLISAKDVANSASHMFGTPVLDLNAFNMEHRQGRVRDLRYQQHQE